MADRGSNKLMAAREFSEDDLSLFSSLAEEDGIRLVDWRQFGRPAVEGLGGAFHVQPETAGAIVDRLISSGLVGHLRVFPRGVPAVQLVEIEFGSSAQR